jgi:replicative DNA helicase
MRKVYPFLKPEYFHDSAEKVVFEQISEFIDKYNSCPTIEALKIQIQGSSIPEHVYDSIGSVLTELQDTENTKLEWLVDKSEEFCKDKSLYNAIRQSIQIIDGQDKQYNEDAIPSILQEALAIAFDTNIGHDYSESGEARYEFYHAKENRLPFDIEMLNTITNGGLPDKSLTCVMAETGKGKSLVMCHMAAANISIGKNVLYITMEMAEERIAERIDANLMNIPLQNLKEMPKNMYMSRIDKIKEKCPGKLIIKEYPTAAAHAGHFKSLLNELALKKSFVPDVIYIDYLNICASSRYKASSAVNSYTIVKSIAEELRGLAVEYSVPIVTATQVNRTGFGNSDISLTDTSESIGLPATLDLFIALISTEELEKSGQIMIKQLKNRFGDPNTYQRFIVGIDRSRMKLYDIDAVSDGVKQDEENRGFGLNRVDRSGRFDDFSL